MSEKNLSVRAGDIWEEALEYLEIDGRHKVKDRKTTLSSSDTKRGVEPETFTKGRIIDRILFELFEVEEQPGEKKFNWSDKDRSVDYCLENKNGDAFVVEAKPLNGDLNSNKTDAAVNQVKDVFELRKGYENYEFGIATDGRRWIVINDEGEVVEDLELPGSILRLGSYVEGKKKPVSEKKQEEITDKFYQWYDSLLHGGKFENNKGEIKHIKESDSFVENIYYAEEEDRPDIAQTIANRLIFIKFLQSKQIIGEDVLNDLKQLDESQLNDKMKELFFKVMNKESRVNISEEFRDIPYLNGSLFSRNSAEENNPDYQVKYEILKEFIEFLDQFAFVNKESLEEKEAIDPKILGYIFERAMTSDEREDTGAYYTPRAVTHYIAENTVKPTLLNKSRDYLKQEKGYEREENLPESIDELIRKHKNSLWDIRQEVIIEDFKVADPACGSGAFLLSVANILWDIHQRIDERIGNDYSDIWLKKTILRNNIYGIDINHKATEIARLRLWLWLVDSYDSSSVDALPNIDYNILSGNTLAGFVDITTMKEKGNLPGQNSLSKWSGERLPELFKKKNEQISRYRSRSGSDAEESKKIIEKLDEKISLKLNEYYTTYAKDSSIDLSEEELLDLDLFHWGAEFTDVYDPEEDPENRGFDVLVGNPPYIKYKKMGDSTKELLGELYETPYFEYDISVPFIERSQNLINYKGKLGFITTKQWLKTRYGELIREKLIEEKSVEELIDFTDQQVFRGVQTYTTIIILNNSENESIRYGEIKKLDNDVREKLSQVKNFNQSKDVKAFSSGYETLTRKNWSFLPVKETQILTKETSESISSVTENICQGVVTGNKDVFVLDVEEESDGYYKGYSDELDEYVKLEKDLCRVLVDGDHITRWSADSDMIILYPYRIEDGESELIRIEEIKENYPKTYEYLSDEKVKEALKPEQNQWHEYNTERNQDIEVFKGEKVVIAKLANQSKSYHDLEEHIFVQGMGAKLKHDNISYPYFVALINSRLLEWMVQQTSRGVSGNTFSYAEKFIEDLPVPQGDQAKLIGEISQKLKSLSSDEDYLKDNIEALENLIDYLVYEMYFEEFDKGLLEAIKTEKEGKIDSTEDIQRLKESSSIEEKMKSMNGLEEVRIVERGKSRKNHWID